MQFPASHARGSPTAKGKGKNQFLSSRIRGAVVLQDAQALAAIALPAASAPMIMMLHAYPESKVAIFH